MPGKLSAQKIKRCAIRVSDWPAAGIPGRGAPPARPAAHLEAVAPIYLYAPAYTRRSERLLSPDSRGRGRKESEGARGARGGRAFLYIRRLARRVNEPAAAALFIDSGARATRRGSTARPQLRYSTIVRAAAGFRERPARVGSPEGAAAVADGPGAFCEGGVEGLRAVHVYSENAAFIWGIDVECG